MSQYHIIDVLFRFRQEKPDYTLNLIEGDSLALMEMVRDGRLELAFIRSGEEIDPHFQQIECARDTLVAVIPKVHPLAKRKEISLRDLKDETLLLLSSDTFMYRFCIQACQKAGFDPNVGYTGRRSENLLAMAEKGAGIALLTQNPIQHPVSYQISIVEICPAISTSIRLIYSKNHKLSPAAKAFISLLS
jgi:DNA-binding transcriptional LysR family regulator